MPGSEPTGTVVLANTPDIQNVNVPSANTEVPVTLPNATRKLTVKSRLSCTVKFSFTLGSSGTTFITIPPGSVYSDDNLDLNDATLYLQTDKASQIIEVLSWSRA